MSNLDNEPHLPHFLTPPEYKRKNMLVKYLVLLNICNFCTLVYFLLITMLCLQKPCFMWHVRSHHCHVNCQVVINLDLDFTTYSALLQYSNNTICYNGRKDRITNMWQSRHLWNNRDYKHAFKWMAKYITMTCQVRWPECRQRKSNQMPVNH